MNRSAFVSGALAAGSTAFVPSEIRAAGGSVTLPFANGDRPIAAYPEKRPLIVLTTRPVQLETPFSVFDRNVLTPNDAFYVRWHLAGVPTRVDLSSFRINVHGLVNHPLQLSVDDLRNGFDTVEIVAVCECAGNSRGFSSPRVPGGQWANGAMGNARWKGARLRDVLGKAGVRPGAVQVRFRGLDRPVSANTPTFEKALDVDLATSPDVLIAYEQNGADLPLLNGYPVRLVVPGWYGTYWVKMLTDVEVIGAVDDNFWMKSAYRVPDTPNWSVAPKAAGFDTVPIGRLTVRSFITNVVDGARIKPGHQNVRGIAFDSGRALTTIEFSSDGGRTWGSVRRGPYLGPYSFRQWSTSFEALAGRTYELSSRAANTVGEQQVPRWNPSGYARNDVETITVKVG